MNTGQIKQKGNNNNVYNMTLSKMQIIHNCGMNHARMHTHTHTQ